jgi:carboxymethylenebutenolidase
VIPEWWGLIPQVEHTCDRLAEAGFFALAPDLFGGEEVPLSEPDEAAKAMMALEIPRAAADLSGALDALKARSATRSTGVLGFCMGGGLALMLSATRPDAVGAVVSCYGVHPWAEGAPDLSAIEAAVQVHCAGRDDFFSVEAAEQLVGTLAALGNEVELHVYPERDHAFFNEDRPEVYDADDAGLLFDRTVSFLHAHLR